MVVNVQATIVTGRVTCDGTAVPGVSVSDGKKVVYTDAEGAYTIKTDLNFGYVFISVPSGYEVPSDGVIPQFFKRLDSSQKTAEADFNLKKVDQTKCNFIVYNDIHLTNDPEYHDIDQVTRGFITDVNQHYKTLGDKPLYALTLGDMTTDSRWYKRKFALPEYLEFMRKNFPVTTWHSMGNHDNDIKGGSDIDACKAFRDVIGPHYYSFNIGSFHFVVLDDIVYDMPLTDEGRVAKVTGYKTFVDQVQLSWLRNDLKNVPTENSVVLVAHAPLYRITGLENGDVVYKGGFSHDHHPDEVLYLLEKFAKVYILTGHTHMNYYVEDPKGVLEHNCTSVAGSSWYTESCCGFNMSSDGVPSGYAVYSIDGDQLSWYFKATGFDKDQCQFRAYDMNVVPAEYSESLPENTILLNVFNYDPQWTIEVKEDGKPLEVERSWLRDPLYALGVNGQAFSKKGAFRPNYNSHMFVANATSADSVIEIIVTDRFGRVYRHTMNRPGEFGLDMPLCHSGN